MTSSSNEGYSTEKVRVSADFLKSKMGNVKPKIGIICGSGLSGLGEVVENKIVVKYSEIPSFVESTVPGHKGQLVFGQISGKDVVCMQGRFHPYEGYPGWVVGFPLRVMKLIGIEMVLATNAAGGINPEFKVGDFMLIKDHISFTGLAGYTPLVGPNDSSFGPRFPPMNDAYDKNLRTLFKQCASDLGYDDFMRDGVYCNVFGPSYETIAELRLLLKLGGDAAGMSTVQEVVTARHCGIKVIACSLITNECILEYDTDKTVCHDEVLQTANDRAHQMQTLVAKFIGKC
uniref:purine nucleoside phosphorylase-like n=1 Tax=Ciona intestinalis TaxID=7719 RepID=UPI0000522022|nr:purine nucleoside phosphorylase-like [Ciona intestinalis]|eukprot:XP_002129656.1 purine nucleoside phosphorylase-like [Ciona intestinalis]